MANKIQFKRGLKSQLPMLDVGEPGLCTNTDEVFVGGSNGNIGLVKSEDVKSIASVIASKFPNLKAAIDYAADNNIERVSLGEGIYDVDETIITNCKNLSLYGNGALIKQKADVNIFEINGGFEFTRNIGEIINSTIDVSEENGGNTPVTRLTIEDISNLSVNDIVYIKNDDESIYEYNTVRSIDSANKYIYLSSRIRYAYTTATISKLKDCTFSVEGINFDSDNDTEAWKGRYILCSYLKYPQFSRINVKKGCNSFLSLTKCFGYSIRNSVITNLRNKISGQTVPNLGYGINDGGSINGLVDGCLFINNRHGFTTNGLSHNFKVINSSAFNCSGAGFDTHSDSDTGVFSNCHVFGSYRGNRTDGTGFGIRGINVDVIDCTIDRCFKGIQLFEKFDNGKLINVKIKNTEYSGIEATGESGTKKLTIEDCTIEPITNASAVSIGNVELTLNRSTLKNKSSIANSLCLIATNSIIHMNDNTLDLSEFTGTNGRFATFNGATIVDGSRNKLIQGSANLNNLFTGNNDTGANVVLKDTTGDFTISSIFNLFKYAIEFNSPAVKSGVINHTIGSANTTTHFSIPFKADECIIYNVTASTTSASLLNFGLGNFVGQKLLIKNVGTNSFAINNTGANLILASSKTLTAKQCALFIWDGTSWNGL